MDFAQHLVSYYKGELLEAVLLTTFGITIMGLVVVMWPHVNQNALLKGFFYPIAFLAAFTVLAGGFGVYNNSRRLSTMPTQYAQSATAFVQAENNRFEGRNGVNAWWVPLKILWTALALVGIALSFITPSELTYGVAIGLICIGTMGFLIDGFAHHRAKIYTAALLAQNAVQP